MKFFKSAIIFLFLLSYSLGFVINTTPIFCSQTFYAQIPKDKQVFFYSTPNAQEDSKLFVLPCTYFVELLKNANDTFFYAKYNDIYGYVLKNEVNAVKNVPTSPFLTNINFRVFVPSGANLRSSPYNNGTLNLVYSIPFLDSNLMYYGKAYGEEAISKKGTLWYYCKYFTGNLTYVGYLYAPLCDELTKIDDNTELVEFLDNFSFEDESITTSGEVFKGLSSTATTLIIIAISLPCLLFIYLLFKPTRLAEESANESKSRKRHKSKIKRLKNSDYFELDDDF